MCVVLFSDVRLYREGLADALARQGIDVATAPDIGTRAGWPDGPRPDIAVVDITGPGGHDLLASVAAWGGEVRVVALGVSETEADVLACAEAGAAAYVSRDASVQDLLDTLERAARGEALCSPRIMGSLFRRLGTLTRGRSRTPVLNRLTDREREVLALLDEGLLNKEIALRLSIGLSTVKCHVHNILEKLEVRSRGEAAARFREGGRAAP